MILVLFGITLMIMVSFILVFSLWIQPGGSLMKHHVNRTLDVSHCKGNQTGTQFTEGNVTGNPTLKCK